MKWAELAAKYSNLDSIEMCFVMSELWVAIINHGDTALIANLMASANTPYTQCCVADDAGVDVPSSLLRHLESL